MSRYDWREVEPKWQRWWHENQTYEFDQSPEAADRAYLIDNPPRYASGGLHVGHAVHYTHIDMAARYKRMKGFNVMFPLCFDTNGIPIEERVERKLGVTRLDVDRHEFIEMCRNFANRNIEEMTHEFSVLGCSMDPSVYYQTDADYYRRVTQISFLEMFKRGLVYKGTFPVNWCPRCLTALADAEVEYKDRESRYNNIVFRVEETGEEIIIATTRPELLCTCQMVALHPSDDRASELEGKHMVTPLYERTVPVIVDDAVDPEKGTGIVMICSIGDKEDLQWILKNDLEFEMAIDEQGRMTGRSGKYEGLTVEEAREAIVRDLEEAGLLRGQVPTIQSVGSCWRCKTTVEYLRKPQWFLRTTSYKDAVLDHADEINWYPEHMKKRLEQWVTSLEWDWVISRQRYFATPIPVWECECGEVVVAEEEQCYVDPTVDDPPVDSCPRCGGDLRGCEDVFDTWMDSSISPAFIAFWKRDVDKFNRYFPTGLRPQAHDIIRTWAYYSLVRSHLLFDSKPWGEMMIDGFVLSTDGTPMHASLGNAIDPLETLEEYGGDVMRYLAALCALGQDNNFRPQDLVRGRRFVEKFWNVQQFVELALENEPEGQETGPPEALLDRWILDRLSSLVETVDGRYREFDFAPALREVQDFVWHEFADHYIELVKSRVYEARDPGVFSTLRTVGLAVTKLLAPILPHITEEAYQRIYREDDGADSIHTSGFPEAGEGYPGAREPGEFAKNVASAVRRWKSDQGMSLNRKVESIEIITDVHSAQEVAKDVKATTNAEELIFVAEDPTLHQEARAVKAVLSEIGPRFRSRAGEVARVIEGADPGEISEAIAEGGEWRFPLPDGSEASITEDDIEIEWGWISHGESVETISLPNAMIVIRGG